MPSFRYKVGDVLMLRLVWAPTPKAFRLPPHYELIGYAPDGHPVWFAREKIMKFKEGDVIKARIIRLHPPEAPVLYMAEIM